MQFIRHLLRGLYARQAALPMVPFRRRHQHDRHGLVVIRSDRLRAIGRQVYAASPSLFHHWRYPTWPRRLNRRGLSVVDRNFAALRQSVLFQHCNKHVSSPHLKFDGGFIVLGQTIKTEMVDAGALAAELSHLLHSAGHHDVATLLDVVGDLRLLEERRLAKGGEHGLLGPRDELVNYVLDQLRDLSGLMARHGRDDLAKLLLTPEKLADESANVRLAAALRS